MLYEVFIEVLERESGLLGSRSCFKELEGVRGQDEGLFREGRRPACVPYRKVGER